jgi:hypothetical protein
MTECRGGQLLAALRAADDRIDAVWAEWDTLPRVPGGGILREIRDAFWDRLHKAQADRAAIAKATWAYFRGPDASAEEYAAWWIMDQRWAWRWKSRRQP